MADFVLKRGDTAPTLIAILRDKDGAPVSLTGSSVLFVMRLKTAPTNSTPVVAAPVVVAPDQVVNKGQVSYQWATNDTKSAGLYAGEFVVTLADGREQTFPTSGFVEVQINDDLESHLASLRAPAPGGGEVVETSLIAPETLREARYGFILTTDTDAKAAIARKTAASTAPILTDADLTALLAYARRPHGGYNTNRAAAEGWRWKAGRVAGAFTFSADGVQVDKSMIMDHCLKMVTLYSTAQVRTVQIDSVTAFGPAGQYGQG